MNFLRRVGKDLLALGGKVFTVASAFAVTALILAAGAVLFQDAPPLALLLWPGSMLLIGIEAWIVVSLMRPLLVANDRRWEFLAGWVVFIPVMSVIKAIRIPELPLFSVGGCLFVVVGAAIIALSLLGIFDKLDERRTRPSKREAAPLDSAKETPSARVSRATNGMN